jgi:hypothetical protein
MNSVLFTTEDDLADTIGPRLDILEADSSRITYVSGYRTTGKPHEQMIQFADIDVRRRCESEGSRRAFQRRIGAQESRSAD